MEMTDIQVAEKIEPSFYLKYFEIILNKNVFKERLKADFYSDFNEYQYCISKIHESLIHILIKKNLSAQKKWEQTALDKLFPVSPEVDREILSLDEFIHSNLDHSTIESFHVGYLNSHVLIHQDAVTLKTAKAQSKFNGAFYTSKDIVTIMCKESFDLLTIDQKGSNFRALDFASGTGNFYFEIVKESSNFLGESLIECAKNNVFAFDKDNVALSILKMKACFYLDICNILDLEVICKNIYQLDFIDYGLQKAKNTNPDLFSPVKSNLHDIPSYFDLILSNPPYLNLKYNRPSNSFLPESAHNHYTETIKDTVNRVRNSQAFSNSSSGMLNLYRLSIDLMLSKLSSDGVATVICPSSLFADKTALAIRKELLLFYDLKSITYFREDAKLFEGVTQSTVIFSAKKAISSQDLKVINNGSEFIVSKDLIYKSFPKSMEIPLVDKIGWSIISKLNNFPKLYTLPFLRNKRGELDLTLHKKYITSENTSYQLVRGNRLKKDGIQRDHNEYVNITDFKKTKSNEYLTHDFEKVRLVCNQISNVDSATRLRFLISEPSDIIANSCNYLSFIDHNAPVTFYIQQLNSPLLNWYFKTLSSNNHVNNYELDALPILNHNDLDDYSVSAIQKGDLSLLYKTFALTENEIQYIELS